MGKRRQGGRDPELERVWRDRIAAWAGSGLTVREFCREVGLSEPSFYAWRRTLRQHEAEGRSTRRTPGRKIRTTPARGAKMSMERFEK